MAKADSRFSTRNYQDTDAAGILELLKQSLGESPVGQRSHALWQWKHEANPFGHSHVRLAIGEPNIPIGLRSFMRWQFVSDGRTVNAARAVDTATHPDYRRMGIFSTLTNQVVDQVQESGVALIFNTPNNYSLPGYLKLGWQHVSTVRPLVKVLDYPAFALGLVRALIDTHSPRKLDPHQFFRAEPTPMSALLERRSELEELLGQDERWHPGNEGIRTCRSWDYLNWRYGKHPTIPYWAMCVEEGGHLQSCAIFRTNTRFGMKEIVLCELFLSEPKEASGYQALDRLRALVRADYLITYFSEGSLTRRIVDRWGFRAVPRWGMHFTVKPLIQGMPRDPLLFKNWSLSMGDLELF